MGEDFNYVLITRCGGIGDLLMLEPTIEALYYEYAPARIILRTWTDYVHVLKDHPLIWKIIEDNVEGHNYGLLDQPVNITTLNGLFEEPTPVHHFNMNGVIEIAGNLHGVDAFAAAAGTKLLRRTPSFGHYRFDRNHQVVVQFREFGPDLRGMNEESLPMDLLEEAYIIRDGDLSPQDFIEIIAGADTFIGPDSSGLHIAHAAGVRKIVGHYTYTYPATIRSYPGIRNCRNWEELQWNVETALTEPLYPDWLNQGNAADSIRSKALLHCRGRGLDVGSSHWPLQGCLPIHGPHERDRFGQGPFDFIFSSHCLEHISTWQSELQLWCDSIRVGGQCFIYLPHPAMEMWVPNGPWVGAEHVWAPEPVSLVKWINENTGLRVEEYSCYPDAYWSFYIIARRLI